MSIVEKERPAELSADTAPDIADADEIFVAPTSFAQARLWLLERLDPGLAAYNVPLALTLGGPLRPAALAAALDALVERHETLRSGLAEDLEEGGGQPVQMISPPAPLPLPAIDLSALGPRADPTVLAILAGEAARPFDLSRLTLVRAVLFRLGTERHLLLVNHHHAMTDAWSLGVLLRDLFELYAAARDGRPPRLPELPIQYADFAAWQRDWLQGDALAERLEPWRRRLAGAPATISLPTDRPRGGGSAFARAGGHAPFDLPRGLGATLREVGRAAGATPFMVLLAGYEALLARLAGQGDLVLGTTVANRDRSETENLIGLFVNTLALRCELGDDPSFADHLARVRETTIEAFAHADLPFERLVEELKPERRLAENPLFEVAFAFQRPPLAGAGGDGLRPGILEIDTGIAKFELVLHLVDGDDVIHGFWEYRRALFDRTSIDRLTARLATLLADAAAHPARRISELALLSAAERHQVAVEWAAVEAPASAQPLAYQLFSAQAARTPDLPAATFGDGPGFSLTYRELQVRAERLARRLLAHGAGRERAVAVLVERSLALPVAVLGALAAGAAYVPLDPEYPRERLALIVDDARAAVVVAESRLRERLPASALPLVLLDPLDGNAAADALVGVGGGEPLPAADPDDLAYVLFTSGSTGRPKGVAMPHRALANLLAWQLAVGGAQEGRATLQFAQLSFDASFQEMFATWGAGGTLVLLDDAVRRDPEALLDFVDRRSVGRIFFPSIALQQLAQAAVGRPAPRALRELVTAGEQLQVTPAVRALVGRLQADAAVQPPAVRLHNHYGPTEAHVVTALVLPDGDPGLWPALPAIGRPIPGAVIRLLDARFAPVPIGVPGELAIGGACLARGYRGRAELTAERFVPDPGSSPSAPGARLYRTGDLARFRADGSIEYLGRGDGQVKVRGVRVEPAEVEAVLSTHPQVAECAVVARRSAGAETVLAAYVVSRGGPALAGRLLRDFLRGKLPDALVPSAFVELAALPRTASAKVDRGALPDPGIDTSLAAGFVAPRTPVEEMLAGIWSGVLRLARIGAHDNFFDLGGHSLNATTVTAQVRTTFHVELPARALFEAPTLAELALRVEQLLLAEEGLELPPIVAEPRDGEPPLSFAQQRLWFLDRLAGGASPFYNIAVALGLRGPLAPAALAAALTEIVRRHEALRTTFRAGAGGETVQVVHPPSAFPLPVIDLGALGALPDAALRGEVERLARDHAHRPFSLADGPLLRAGLLRLPGEDLHALLLSMHHIVSDGWSLEVFVRELAALYVGGVEGKPPALAELPVQYADFARWQRRWLAGPVLDTQLAYWQGRLAGAPFTLELPTDRPRPALQSYAGAAALLHLPLAVAEDLRTLARGERATLFMILLAAFAALLERTCGQDDMLLGTPIANRNRAEIEPLIGVFVNTLVLRVELAGEPAWRALLARVRETALAAYAHQDLPFERLVEALQPPRDLSRNPLFQVSFSMGTTPWDDFDRSGLAIGSLGLDLENDLELFDLTLQVFETPGGLDARLAYNPDLFDATTVARLGARLETLLAALAADADGSPAGLPLLSAAERQQLCEWDLDASPLAPAPAATAAALFAAQVALRPEAPALGGDGGLSYEELDRRANRLARHLEGLGVGPEVVVALALDGGSDFATAVLAVWKAGGAYLPLPANLPRERVDYLLADSGVRLLVTRDRDRNLSEVSFAGQELARLDLTTAAAAIGREDAAPRPAPDLPQSLAYVIYTSGSTGRPKGVQVSHQALAAHAIAFAARLDLAPGDRVLQVASFAFDVSLDELVPTLIAGATFVPWRPEGADPAALARTLAEREITVVNLPTALWHQAARAWAEGRLPVVPARLRWVLVGGEALPPGALALWRRTPLAAVPLANGYGPTEAVVTATLHAAAAEPAAPDAAELARLPIGRPFAGRVLRLLDRRGAPVPPGAVGEVHLGGTPLARGYLGRPERTAEAFVPDALAALPGARLYRSGDLARQRGDGSLEFLGRRDRQLKVRGFRVEPEEVEAALLAHPAVRQAAVVLAAGGAAGGLGAEPDGGTAPELRTLAAYLAAQPGRQMPSAAELRAFLGERLPPYMIPSSFVVLDELPQTPGNKVDRAGLPAAAAAAERRRPTAVAAPAGAALAAVPSPVLEPAAVAPLEAHIAALWREVIGLGPEEVGLDDNFFDLGGHSMLLAVVLGRLQEELAPGLSMIELFDHPTVRDLAAHLTARLAPSAARAQAALPAAPAAEPTAAMPLLPAAGESVAVIGMSGRFPGAADVETYWHNLRAGIESISSFLPAGETWQPPESGVFNVPAGGAIDGVELWDADFFGYRRREAEMMDPQQRLFLECAWEALEDAGYGARRGRRGRVGVFGGTTHNDYLLNLNAHGLLAEPAGSDLAMEGNEKDYLTVRVSYKLGLEGPSFTVAAGCATSLVAIHLAAASLLAGECDMALAGGTAIAGRQRAGYLYRPGSTVSPHARCRPFDAASDGTVDSDGAGIVALKRLSDALADGDTIHAVIRGSALTNDGADKIGFLAPRTDGRAAAIAAGLARAGVSPAEIGYVEAHGVGVPLGDAVEVAALHLAFGAAGGPGTCALGSAKGNVGHAHGASGVLGFIKAVLVLEHREIPPTLHYERPNPEIDFATGPFYVNTRLQPWESEGAPRRAGVSSFGHGGVNVHVVLEEAPPGSRPAPRPAPADPWQLLLVSARSEPALAAATARLAEHLERHPEMDLADVAFTLQLGRESFAHRRAVLCRDGAEAVRALTSDGSAHAATRTARRRGPAVVFLLPGTGGGAGPGAELYSADATFRAAYDGAAERLASHLGRDVRGAFGAAEPALADPTLAEPALFAYELALAAAFRGWGVAPDLLLGEGVGELAAAVLGGTLTLDDAAALVALRAGRPTAAAWAAALAAMSRQPPEVRWISAATGRRVEAAEAVDAERWAERLTAEPRLGAALAPLLADRLRVLLPVGPPAGLAALRTAAGEAGEAALAPALAGDDLPAPAAALATLGSLWLAGVEVDWAAYHRGGGRRRLPLPTYPFERQRYWVETAENFGVLRHLATSAGEAV